VEVEAFRQRIVGGGEFSFSVADGGRGGVTMFRYCGLAKVYRTQKGAIFVDRMHYVPDTLTEQDFQVALGDIEAYIEQAAKDRAAKDKAVRETADDAARKRFFD
jgi:hypothetical protein